MANLRTKLAAVLLPRSAPKLALLTLLALCATAAPTNASSDAPMNGNAAEEFAGHDDKVSAKGWYPWVNLGGSTTSDPAACTAHGYTYVFVRGGDNAIWYRRRDLGPGLWTGWNKVPAGTFAGSPAVACVALGDGNHRVHIAAQATDGRLLLIQGWHGSWSSGVWIDMPMDYGAAVSITAHEVGNRLDVFSISRQMGHRLYHRQRYYRRWSAITLINGPMPVLTDPSAVMSALNRMDVVMRGGDGNLWHKVQENGAWLPWMSQPGPMWSSPEVVSRSVGFLDVFARGVGDELIHKAYVNGVWGPWVSLGGVLTSTPGAATYANGQRMMVFVRDTAGGIQYRAWAP